MNKDIDLAKLTLKKKRELLAHLEALKDKRKYTLSSQYYPDTGALSRDKYPKHMEFFESGAAYMERMLMAGNRVGKTVAGSYETTLHLTGDYPDWWPGKVFSGPTDIWAAGFTGETTRDIVQLALLGPRNDVGSGMIPRDLIVELSPKAGGVPDAVDTVTVRYSPGGDVANYSNLGFKQYKQGRKAFEGTKKNAIWFDEEADMSVYNEALLRITSTKGFDYKEGDVVQTGVVYTTFTPLTGISELVQSFMPREFAFTEAA